MLGRRSAALTRIFYILYALCFGGVLFCCVFANVVYPYDAVASLLLMAIFAAIFLLAYRLFARHVPFIKRYGALICAAVVLFTGILQLVNGFAMRYDPGYDLWAVYGGGMTWAEKGTLAGDEYYLTYFHMFPDNLGGAFLFRCLFGLSGLLGITDHYAVALVFNVLLLQASLVLCYDVLRRVAGSAAGMLALLVFVLFPPFYMMGPVFYTDLLSVVPPILALDLFFVARGQKTTGRRVALYAVMGLAVGVGAVVKFTVTIALVAVGIASVLAPPHRARAHFARDVLLPLGAALAVFLLVLACWGGVKNATLDEERLERDAMPFSHWIAMGLIGEGGYDEADYDRAMKLPTRAARAETNMELIKIRLTQPSPLDLVKLFTRKAIRCFGDGTYDLGIFLDDGPHQRAAVHELVLRDGEYYALYGQLSQGVYLGLFALSLVPPVQAALAGRRGCRALRTPAPWLCLFGLFLFLMMWETNSRYTLNYMPVLVVCACLGAAWLRKPWALGKARVPKQEAAGCN